MVKDTSQDLTPFFLKTILILLFISLYLGTAYAQDYSAQGQVKIPLGKLEEYQQIYTVQRVIDGNTLELSSGERVRLIGVDTAVGQEATEFVKSLGLEGEEVRLEFDVQERDAGGNLLAYVYVQFFLGQSVAYAPEVVTKDGMMWLFVNATIVKNGYGFADTLFPFKYMDEFKALETEARENQRGIR